MAHPKVLLISFLFPPNGGVAVLRALSFARYFPAQGVELHVLKCGNASGPVKDPTLLRQVPGSVQLHNAYYPEIPFELKQAAWRILGRSKSKPQAPSGAAEATAKPSANARSGSLLQRGIKRILSPEPEVLWVPFALRKARRIIRKYGINTVLVTAPPFSTFLVGNRLKKDFPGLKLISDFRDDWLGFYLRDFEFQGGDFARQQAIRIERETAESSDLVVAVTPTTAERMQARYPDLPPSRFAMIPNGYEPESLPDLRRDRDPAKAKAVSRKIVVVHTGTVYKATSVRRYLDALDELPAPVRDRFETRLVGRVTAEEASLLTSRKSTVKQLGFLPQKEALQTLADADYALVLMTDEATRPQKLLEYLGMGKPVLAIGKQGGEMERLLSETGGGWCVDASDREAIKALLTQAADGTLLKTFQPNRKAIERYQRPQIAGEYVRQIEALLANSPNRQQH
jgi:glycosyltransferase involved in cell wall biosynthesis